MKKKVRVKGLIGRGFLTAVIAHLGASAGSEAQTLADAISELHSGSYDQAISTLRTIALDREISSERKEMERREAYVLYLEALGEVGRYDDALNAGREAPDELSVALANTLGEILYKVGRVDEARAAFARSIDGSASDRNSARLNQAIAEWDYGDRKIALAEFDTFIDIYNGAATLSSEDLVAVGTAVRYLGVQNHELYKDALRAYDEAISAAPGNLEARVLIGELFLNKYNGPEADAAMKDVIARNPNHPRALLGLARAMEFNGTPGLMEQTEKALEQNENLVAGRVFKAKLLLGLEEHDEARIEIQKALSVNPASLEAFSVLAAINYLRGQTEQYERIRDRVRALSPSYAELYNDIAELSAQSRKYREASRLAAEAIEIDAQSWRAYGILGMNQLRLGQIEEGSANLETAFEGDPYNVWFFNTLDLLDTFEYYQVSDDDPRFLFVLHDREAAILKPYVEQIAAEAYGALKNRYGGYEPPLPIRIEVYPSHADFSVRTVGLAGMGALGVAFGSVLAMDSPAARPLGEFNWASVLWHELAHVFHLGLTDHEVPRWFSEGLAVHEQRQARDGWGHQVSPGFLDRYREGLLLPVSQLNAGFVQPSYPEQVVDSYLQASLVFDFIETRWGFQPIFEMLRGYRESEATPELVDRLLGMSMDELDKSYDEYFRGRFETAIKALALPDAGPDMFEQPRSIEDWTHIARENPGYFQARLALGIMLFREDRLDESEEHLQAALRLFPEYGGRDSPYWYLAQIHRKRGETELSVSALQQLTALNESHYEAFLQLGELQIDAREVDESAAALDAAVLIYPYEIELHERLAEAHTKRGDFAGAVRERRAIVALAPADLAEAYYQLARAYFSDNRPTEARRAVLRALEIAPTYEDALEFLLEVRAGTTSTSDTQPVPETEGQQ